MSAQRTAWLPTSSLASFLARIGWLLLFAMHLPAGLRALSEIVQTGSAASLVRVVLLVGTLVLLLGCGVGAIRLPNSAGFWIRFLLIVALLHVGVVGVPVDNPQIVVEASFVLLVMPLARVARLAGRLARVLHIRLRAAMRSDWRNTLFNLPLMQVASAALRFLLPTCPHRAPPILR